MQQLYLREYSDRLPDDEISAEMVEAGALEFAGYDPRFESDEEAVVRIYPLGRLLEGRPTAG